MYNIDPLVSNLLGQGNGYYQVSSSHTLEGSKKLYQCLAQKDFKTIVKDPDLFWLSFCHSFFYCELREKDHLFSVSIKNEEIQYSGGRGITEGLRKNIEELRHCLISGLDSRINVRILQTCYSFFPSKCILTLDNPSKELVPPIKIEIYKDWYEGCIKPLLPEFIANCGAVYESETAENSRDSVIHIKWKNTLVYPVVPKSISEPKPLGEILYPLYQKQECCDFSLCCEDGTLIKCHSALLYAYGGSVLQTLLTSGFKESKEKVITFEKHTKDAINSFLEFIYLGGKEFSEKMILSTDLDIIKLYELFDFAHMYGIEILMDCCTNLISLKATKEDLSEIKELASFYNNEHLQQLCNHFSPEQKNNLIKV